MSSKNAAEDESSNKGSSDEINVTFSNVLWKVADMLIGERMIQYRKYVKWWVGWLYHWALVNAIMNNSIAVNDRLERFKFMILVIKMLSQIHYSSPQFIFIHSYPITITSAILIALVMPIFIALYICMCYSRRSHRAENCITNL